MPRLTYSPEGVEPSVWDFEFEDLLMPESIAICKASGLTMQELGEAFIRYNPAVVYATFQVLARRNGRDGKALQPRAGELDPDFTAAEYNLLIDAAVEQFGRDPGAWSDEQRDGILEMCAKVGKTLDDIVAGSDAAVPELDDEEIVLDDGSEAPAPEPEDPKA